MLNLCRTVCQALLGQKYGYRPFPPTIDADEFSAIRAELATAETAATGDDDGDDKYAGGDRQASLTLLDTWFKRNTNVIPPVYTLQPISSVLPDYALDSVSDHFSNFQQMSNCYYFATFLRHYHSKKSLLLYNDTSRKRCIIVSCWYGGLA